MVARKDVPRLSPRDVADMVQQGDALLVCAYDDEQKCSDLRLEGAMTLQEFQHRYQADDDLQTDQTLIFYCA